MLTEKSDSRANPSGSRDDDCLGHYSGSQPGRRLVSSGCGAKFRLEPALWQTRFDASTDLDLVFYDPTISYEETLQIEQGLKKTYPQYAWEVQKSSLYAPA